MSRDLVRKYLDPELINKVAHLELKARRIIEGYLTGRQRSHLKGVSVEFASHREYTQGDDIRHLDWKVFARTDKLYIKEYEQETNVNAFIALDISRSMLYGSGSTTKFEYACAIASALSYLFLIQHDSVGFALFDNSVKKVVPSLTGDGQIIPILETIDGHAIEEKTDIANVFHQLASLFRRKTFIIVISDLLEDEKQIEKGLEYLVGKRNELSLIHVLDQKELDLSFRDLTMFEGLEDNFKQLCDPMSVRSEYVRYVNEFLLNMKKMCSVLRAEYSLFSTQSPLDKSLPEFLITRLEHKR